MFKPLAIATLALCSLPVLAAPPMRQPQPTPYIRNTPMQIQGSVARQPLPDPYIRNSPTGIGRSNKFIGTPFDSRPQPNGYIGTQFDSRPRAN